MKNYDPLSFVTGEKQEAEIPTIPEQANKPVPLFRIDTIGYGGRYDYAPAPDGRRFLVLTGALQRTLHVIVGWRP